MILSLEKGTYHMYFLIDSNSDMIRHVMFPDIQDVIHLVG